MSVPVRPLHQEVAVLALIAGSEQWDEVLQSWEGTRPGSALGCEWVTRFQTGRRIVALHTGDDPLAAAVSAQYAVDRWKPQTLAAAEPLDAYTHVAERNGLDLALRDGAEVSDWIAAL